MKISTITLLAFTMLAMANCADGGETADGTPIPATTVQPLAQWVEQQTDVKMPALPIVVASEQDLRHSLGLDAVQQARAVAAYIPGRVYIDNLVWDPNSVVSESYLVHELVHHAQLFDGKTYPCHAAKEREAYTLQNKWLAEHGEGPVVTESWIDRISSCSTGNDYDSD
ncbi:MAG TPA: DUF6647 family protein [Alphaproteobacteria bacterium]|nr:DUF6647 family protein [Alphaproteobacteria bacterium]